MLTRKSTARSLPKFIFIRPSWGMRFSEMSSLEMTLMREASLSLMATGGLATSRSSPSMRNRTRYWCSKGSKCRSEARMPMASTSIFCKNFTTGASSTSLLLVGPSLRPSAANSSSSTSSPTIKSSTSAVDLANISTQRESLSYSAITQSTCSPLANLMRSAAVWSDGSAVATIKRLPRLLRTNTPSSAHTLASNRSLGSFCGAAASKSISGVLKASDTL